jgi:hypothetical protein
MRNAALPLTLLVSALALSACATKPKESPVAAPVTIAAEQPAAPAVEAVIAPIVIAEQQAVVAEPAPKQVVVQPRKKVIKAKRKATPEPVAIPAPVVQQEAPAVLPPEPTPPAVISQPIPEAVAPGFLEQYWLWLLGLVLAGIAAVWWMQRNKR